MLFTSNTLAGLVGFGHSMYSGPATRYLIFYHNYRFCEVMFVWFYGSKKKAI